MAHDPYPELRGARILITGGSSGIGLVTAERLAASGARVVLLARGEEGLADALRRVPGCEGAVAADVARADETIAAVAEAVGILGGLDAVVAGAGAAAYGPFAQMQPDDYCRTVETTLLGALNTAKAVLPELERTRGTLLFVGSVAGRIPVPWLAAYAAAKHGCAGSCAPSKPNFAPSTGRYRWPWSRPDPWTRRSGAGLGPPTAGYRRRSAAPTAQKRWPTRSSGRSPGRARCASSGRSAA